MRSIILILLLLGLLPAHAGEPSHTFYIQVIRGTGADADVPASYKRIGPKLAKRLSPVFRWQCYWEVKRQSFEVRPGKTTRLSLGEDRALEMEWTKPGVTQIRLFRNGQKVRCSRQSAEEEFSMMGWDDLADNSWFVVVRRGGG